ncbi:MAG: hypothetical protein ACE5LS_00775 [Thermoplasmata archaeon]
MGKGILISGIVLGVFGILWSILTFVVVLLLVAFGAGGTPLLLSALGFLMGIVAIVGGAVGNKRTRAGSAVLIAAGAVVIATAFGVALSLPGVSALDGLRFSLGMGWWAYGLLIAGILGIARGERPEDTG